MVIIMKKKTIPVPAAVLLMLVTAAAVFILTYLSVYTGFYFKSNRYPIINEIDQLVNKYYIGDVDGDAISDWVAYGYMAGLGDKYGTYMNPADFSDYLNQMEGQGAGIGVRVMYNKVKESIDIISVMPGTPAETAGILPGDRIVGIDNRLISELGYENAVNALAGEIGTVHELRIIRNTGAEYPEMLVFNVQIAEYDAITVEYHMFTGDSNRKTGVIRIYEFAYTTDKEFIAAVDALVAAGAEQLVFDVRDNPGGSLDSVVAMLDYLLPEGPIVRITDKNGKIVETYNSDAEHFCDLPMAVLTNGNSASASELFTSALLDYNKAFTVGTTTYGKGTVLSIFPLSNGGALIISTYMYNPPFNGNFEGVGIAPGINVPLPDGTNIYMLDDSTDTQLICAVQALDGR